MAESKKNMLKLFHEKRGYVDLHAVINTSKSLIDFGTEKGYGFFVETCVMGE